MQEGSTCITSANACVPACIPQPIFAVTTATVANPREHACELLGVPEVAGESALSGKLGLLKRMGARLSAEHRASLLPMPASLLV